MIYSNLFNKDVYTIPETYVISGIYEYDISKANINILFEKGVIGEETYNSLFYSDKKNREVAVGNMQKNVNIARALSEGFKEFRHLLFQTNMIQNNEIVSIKKDAVFVTRPLNNTIFGRVEFKLKNIYSLMIKLNGLEIYYGLDINGKDHLIDIKGIRDEKLNSYEHYLFNIFISIFSLIITNSYVAALNLLNQYIDSYINLKLDISTYREFNRTYMFRIKNSIYMSDIVNQEHIDCIDISYNLNILLELKMILINMYYN